MNVVMTAGEEVAEFVGEEDGQECGGEGEACEQGRGIFVEEGEGAEEFIEGGGLVVGIGDGELSAGGEAGAEGEQKESYCKDEGFEGRARKNRDVVLGGRGQSGPVAGGLYGVYGGILWWCGHEEV